MTGAAGFVRGFGLPMFRVARLVFPARAATMATAGMVPATAAVPWFPLPASGINPSLCVVAAVLTWFAARLMAGPHGAGVPNIGTSGDKVPHNGRGDPASPRAEQTRAEQI